MIHPWIEIPLEFHALQSGLVHGLAFWFDVAFFGSSSTVWLSTAPTEPLTHWYQVRCLLETPLFVKQGQLLTGTVLLLANKRCVSLQKCWPEFFVFIFWIHFELCRQSYDVTIDLRVEGSGLTSTNTLDLKNPYFRYAGQPAQPPPGHSCTSPSETYWAQLDVQGARQGKDKLISFLFFNYFPVILSLRWGLAFVSSCYNGQRNDCERSRRGIDNERRDSCQQCKLFAAGSG